MAITNKRLGTVEHVGMVLKVRGTFRQDTSMDEVLVWHPETGRTSYVYLCGDTFAEVDASDEIKQAYRDSVRNYALELIALNDENRLKSVQVGSVIRVVGGRKTPKGTIAKVVAKRVEPHYTMLILDNGMATYESNVLVQYNGEFIEPIVYVQRTFYFDAV